MRFGFTPKFMWKNFFENYQFELAKILHIQNEEDVVQRAYPKYKEIILSVNEYKEKSRFESNIYIAAMLASIYLTLDERPSIEQMIEINRRALLKNKMMQRYIISNKNYTENGQKKLEQDAQKSMQDNNPHSWQYVYEKGDTNNQYTLRFKTCGVLHLYRQLGIEELTPAMCALDDVMAYMNNTEFTRESTLYDGAEECDCHYNYKAKS